jgi:hypothetical protein
MTTIAALRYSVADVRPRLTTAISLLCLLLLAQENARAAERVDAKTWRAVKVYDMAALKQLDPLPMRKIVGVRFNYRHRTIRHLKPTWYQGSIWRYARGVAQEDFDYVQVMVSAADLEAFKALPSDIQGERTFLVYGQVLKDYEAGFTFLRLLGRKVKRDARGNALVRW